MNIVDLVLHYATINLWMRTRIKVVKRINLFRYSSRLQARKDYFLRHKDNAPDSFKPRITMKDGYALDLVEGLPHLGEVMRDARKILNEEKGVEISVRKPFLMNHLNQSHLERYPSFISMATSDDILAIVANYLGFIPVLSEIALWYSKPGNYGVEKSSQLYHLDNADTSQVKVFVHLDDVLESGGPFTFLGAHDSEAVIKTTKYGKKRNVERLSDEVVYGIVPSSNKIECAFDAGAIAYVDTCKCLHFGSRCLDEGRKILMLQYLSPCRADFRQNNLSKLIKNSDSELRKFALDPTMS
mgnify:CR=1 FL=1